MNLSNFIKAMTQCLNLPERESSKRQDPKAPQLGKKGGKLSAIYANRMVEWEDYAKAAPRNMSELVEKMRELSGKAPAQGTVYAWCIGAGVTVRIDKPKSGIYRIGAEMLKMIEAGAKREELIKFSGTKGYSATWDQIVSAVGHARRKSRE